MTIRSHSKNGSDNSFDGLGLRLRRLFSPDTGRSLIIPLDHAITMGPRKGLEQPRSIIEAAALGKADAVMLRPGMVSCLSASGAEELGIILALTGRLASGVDHVLLNSVEYAAAQAADAVCGEFKFGSSGDLENARIIAQLAERAHTMGLPVLVTVYSRPEALEKLGSDAYAHACRIAEEIGADVIKTLLPDDPSVITQCVESTSVPIVLAGGPPDTSTDLEDFLRRAVDRGIGGAAIGRRAWAANKPVEAIRGLVDRRSRGARSCLNRWTCWSSGSAMWGCRSPGKPSRQA
ncbi:class I fructose-bisphosphate aldolase [Streptomyces platensis]|uniref:class I fructose-bisphosphate aldolase n=1 Tax=Streptomyces platensis TaxID=58346 RepID=UPI003C30200D